MSNEKISELYQRLSDLETTMLGRIEQNKAIFKSLHPDQVLSAGNLLNYLSLRSQDIRQIQDQLHIFGLSSLASSESHIHSQLQSILQRLGKHYNPEDLNTCNYESSRIEMDKKSEALFGKKKDAGIPYIMVTFDATFADNYALIKNLLQNGMNVARINCAHDDEVTWSKMIHKLKRACRYTNLPCKIYMDMAGPKIRVILLNKGREKGKAKVREGQLIWLSEETTGFLEDDVVISPNEPGIITALKKGERVYIDDGIIKGVVEAVRKDRVSMRIVRISSDKRSLKAGKGINFPDSTLPISPLTGYDRECLPFICEHADMIGYSFVRYPSDLAALRDSLHRISSTPPKIIVKIETPEAVKNLPALLLQGMKDQYFGLMIARGDLAVEIGFERMGEIQEEILWISEAAHVPVIWATQVLESLNKSGVATRSEITDASHAAMAECVMINKGDHTIEVIETLRDILKRTGGHHIKKRFTFRPLSIAENFMLQ
ncbi:MAG: pyruvate kinase [Chitinophagaceae bacterium]|nr:pyruvate kinase [Chitinophagaceae bacterium]